MTRHDSLDALKAQFGADLRAAQAQHSPHAAAARARRPIRRRRVVLSAVAAAAALSVGALVLSGGPAERLNVVAQAEAALAPKPGILHMRVRFFESMERDGKPVVNPGGHPTHPPGGVPLELWSTTNPTRWRTRSFEPDWQGVPHTQIGSNTAHVSLAADHAHRAYYPSLGRAEIITDIPERVSDLDDPTNFWWGPMEKVTPDDVPTMLQNGVLRDGGLRAVEGGTARRLVGRSVQRDGAAVLTYTYEYFVNPQTFAPIQTVFTSVTTVLTEDKEYGRPKGTELYRSRVKFEVYEHLPATPENERLLEIDAPAGTKVLTRKYRQNPRKGSETVMTQGGPLR